MKINKNYILIAIIFTITYISNIFLNKNYLYSENLTDEEKKYMLIYIYIYKISIKKLNMLLHYYTMITQMVKLI